MKNDAILPWAGDETMLTNQVQRLTDLRAQHDDMLVRLGTILSFARNYKDKNKSRPFQANPIEGYQYSLLDAVLFADRAIRTFKALKLNKDTPVPFAPFDQVIAQSAVLNGTINELVAQAQAIKNYTGEVLSLSGSRLQAVDSGQILADIADMAVRTVNATDQMMIPICALSGLVAASLAAANNQTAELVKDETADVIAALQQVESSTKEAQDLLTQVRSISAAVEKMRSELASKLAEAKANADVEIDALNKVATSVSENATKASSDAAVAASKREEIDRLTAQAQTAYKELSGFEVTLQTTQKTLAETYDRANKLTGEFEGQRKKVEEMVAQAERMVSGSTIVGLARAFDEERKSLDAGMKGAFIWFVVGIVLLFLTSALLAAYVLNLSIPGLEWLTNHKSSEPNIAQVVSRAIIVIAPFWLTLFSARRYRSLFDLRQQYSHKYNMAFSMDGFKTQAPGFAESIAAWVFTIVAANPVLPQKGKSMDTPPPMTIEGMMKEVREMYEKVMGKTAEQ